MASQPKVAVYARVSTDEQSADAQLRDLREYVRRRGWTQVQEFVDLGVSGSKDARPAWSELWALIQRRKVNIVATAAIDRIGRSLSHLVKVMSTLVENQITLISLRECIDLSTPSGRMLAGVLAVMSDYELSIIKERTRAGMRAAKARGSRIGPRKNYLCPRKATELLDKGLGQIKVARALGVGVGRINQFVHDEYIPAKQRRRLLDGVATMEDPDG